MPTFIPLPQWRSLLNSADMALLIDHKFFEQVF